MACIMSLKKYDNSRMRWEVCYFYNFCPAEGGGGRGTCELNFLDKSNSGVNNNDAGCYKTYLPEVRENEADIYHWHALTQEGKTIYEKLTLNHYYEQYYN